MEIAQKFSLGNLISLNGSSAPEEVKVVLQGRGTFCRVVMEFHFAFEDADSPRLLTVERPWNAILVSVGLNGEQVDESSTVVEPKLLPSGLKMVVEEALEEGAPEFVCCFFENGQSLRTVTLEFLMACDVLWHRSSLGFMAASHKTSLEIDVNWDLSGLPDAQLECVGLAEECRFSTLESARCQWSETFAPEPSEMVGIVLALDEKKAASICLYSKAPDESGQGCGAVLVVAPVRQQLFRKPVRLAVIVEIRNPQEGLLTRDLVDKLSNALNPQDQLSIFFMGPSVSRNVMDWRPAGEVQEEDITRLLDPEFMGRTQYFWESFQKVMEECQGATHVLLSSPGSLEASPDDFVCHLPVFCFATGRKPYAPSLEDLASRSGGFLGEQSVDGVDSFLERLKIRLSPPLLRDFRLDGWGLDKLYPPGVTQVYTDKPTLVLGLYEGLLPQTVTLGGLSPAGQKLAQRVRVENFTQFDLMPLFKERSRDRSTRDSSVRRVWNVDEFCLFECTRPLSTGELFQFEESDSDASGDIFAPPSIDIVPSAFSFEEDELFGSTEPKAGEDLFSGPVDSGSTITDDMFGGGPSLNDEPLRESLPSLEKESESFEERDDLEASFRPVIGLSTSESDEEGLEDSDDMLQFGGAELDSDPFAFSSDMMELTFDEDPEQEETTLPAPEPETFPSLEPEVSSSSESEPAADSSSFDDTAEASISSALEDLSPTSTPETYDDRPTLTVAIPGWVRRLSYFDGDFVEQWLASCSLDDLALALVDTEQSIAYSFVQKLTGPRKVALELQMEFAKLLSAEERREASLKLDEELKSLPV